MEPVVCSLNHERRRSYISCHGTVPGPAAADRTLESSPVAVRLLRAAARGQPGRRSDVALTVSDTAAGPGAAVTLSPGPGTVRPRPPAGVHSHTVIGLSLIPIFRVPVTVL
eukprot:752506-Hanusia_phi.AAC.5